MGVYIGERPYDDIDNVRAAAHDGSVKRVHVLGKTFRIHTAAHLPLHFFDGDFVCVPAFCLVYLFRHRRMSAFSDEVYGVNHCGSTSLFQHDAPHHEHSQTLVVTQMHCSSVLARDQPDISAALDQLLGGLQAAACSCSVQRGPQPGIQLFRECKTRGYAQ